MSDPKLARLQAKIYIKHNMKALFGLYVICRLSYSLVYILLATISLFLFKSEIQLSLMKTMLTAASTLISAPIIFTFIERYKQKHFPTNYNFSQSIIFSVVLGIVVSLFSLANLVTMQGTWQMLVLAISFVGTGIFAPFYVFGLLTKEDTLKNQLLSTKSLVKNEGLNYFKNLLAFIPIGFVAAAIITLPTYAIQTNMLLSGLSPLLAAAAEEAISVLFTIVAVFPVYVEVKLYLSVFFMFSQNDPCFDFQNFL